MEFFIQIFIAFLAFSLAITNYKISEPESLKRNRLKFKIILYLQLALLFTMTVANYFVSERDKAEEKKEFALEMNKKFHILNKTLKEFGIIYNEKQNEIYISDSFKIRNLCLHLGPVNNLNQPAPVVQTIIVDSTTPIYSSPKTIDDKALTNCKKIYSGNIDVYGRLSLVNRISEPVELIACSSDNGYNRKPVRIGVGKSELSPLLLVGSELKDGTINPSELDFTLYFRSGFDQKSYRYGSFTVPVKACKESTVIIDDGTLRLSEDGAKP